jgi:hypothetical protein
MTLRWMYDASEPPTEPPHWHVAAGYIGGDTPHVWTEAEWNAQWSPFRLPIFSASNREDTPAAAGTDAWAFWAALESLKVPHGVTVAVDIETAVYKTYLSALDEFLNPWRLMAYGSLSTLLQNPKPSGNFWAGDWTDNILTGTEVVGESGIVCVQWANATMLNKPYDASVIEGDVTLWAKPQT